MTEKYSMEIKRKINCDVFVAGGGVAGAAAAAAAARRGVSVILCESSGILGGQATNGIVTPLSSVQSRSGKKFGGIVDEIIEKTIELSEKYALPDKKGNFYNRIACPEILSYVMLKMCVEAGVKIMFHTELVGIKRKDKKIECAYVFTKSGLFQINADKFIDATGDGALFAEAGEEYALGSEKGVYESLFETGLDSVHYEDNTGVVHALSDTSGLMQPVSIFFVMGGVDYKKASAFNNKRLTYSDLGISKEEFHSLPYFGSVGFEENGDLIPLPQGRILVSEGISDDYAVVNMSRINGINGADADDVNRAETEARLQLMAIVDFLKRYVPGFENSYLVNTGSTLGIRETRRLKGKYILSGKEVIECRHFEDAIAKGSYMIDIHDPRGKNKALGGELKGDFYEIPYGCICAVKNENLFVCGRCISVDHVAHSSTRIQGTCIMTGQAAGTACALSVKNGDVTVSELRQALIEDGVNL